jgi:MFS family permease
VPSLIGRAKRRGAVRRIAIARTISLAGSDATGVALGFSLYQQTHSAAWLSASLLATVAASTVAAPIGGWVGDRFDRKRVMVACELMAAVMFITLCIVHTPVALVGLALAATLLGSSFGPAAGAAIAHIAGDEDLSRANGLVAMGSNVGKMAGRLAAGGIVALLGAGAVFLVDATTFIASAALIASLTVPFGGVVRRTRTAAGRLPRLNLDVLRHPVVRLVTASACISTLVTSFSMTAEVPLVSHFGAGAIGLGALTACWGLGMLAGSWSARRRLHAGNEATGLMVGRILMAIGIGGVALAPGIFGALACYVAGGLGGGFMGVATQSLLTRNAPDEKRSRVLGAVDMCRNAAFGLGVIFAGALVGPIGAQLTYAFVGIGVLVGVLPVVALVRRLGGPRPLRLPSPVAVPAAAAA